MKLIIQIPCFNEERTLPQVIEDLPKELSGIDEIEYLVIDDGSGDRTVEVAGELGVHHVVELGSNRGLATAFCAGIRECLLLGADIIVNTDGDNQYKASCIGKLIAPIVEGKADVIVGSRPIDDIKEFSWLKKKLQKLGSGAVRKFSGTIVSDTTSGFRAYSCEAAMKLHVFNRYSYTLETLIQAGAMNLRVVDVPIEVNKKTRESRLISSIPKYMFRSAAIIFGSYVIYRPFRTFLYLSLLPGLIGLGLCVRFLYYFLSADGYTGHIQSLVLAAILLLIAFHLFALGILASVMGANRKLIQEGLFLERTQLRASEQGRPDSSRVTKGLGD